MFKNKSENQNMVFAFCFYVDLFMPIYANKKVPLREQLNY